MKRRLSIALLLLTLLVAAGSARPVNSTEIVISSSQPEQLELRAGGEARVVRFLGRGFDAVTSAQILCQDRRVRALEPKIVSRTATVMEVELQAPKDLEPRSDYRLVLFTRRWSMWVPLRIEVVPLLDAAEIRAVPSPTPGWFHPEHNP